MSSNILGMNFRLFSLFGTEVKAHISMAILLILALVNGLHWATYVGLMFFFVLVHEFAHIGMARVFGRYCHEITLMVFGAGAKMDPLGVPRKDILIAAAGPASNFAIAGLFYALRFQIGRYEILDMCIMVNVVLGIFNLIPLWPMDGGRIMVNFLKMIGLSTPLSTNITFWVSTATVIVVLFYFHSLFMIIMMSLVWFGLYSTWRKGRILSA